MKFQSSETSRAEVTIYTHGADEPGQSHGAPMRYDLFGAGAGVDDMPILVRVQTSKRLGEVAGSFSFDVKTRDTSFIESVGDDDWVDISMTKHGVRSLVMRGQIEDVRRIRGSGGTGATVTVYRISGRDFGRVFDMTSLWLDQVSEAITGMTLLLRVFGQDRPMSASPADTVESILSGSLRVLSAQGVSAARGTWRLPPLLPTFGVPGGDFVDSVAFFSRDFLNYPLRVGARGLQLFSMIDGSIWNLAAEWSDPMLCELYCDLMVGSSSKLPPTTAYAESAPFSDPDQTQSIDDSVPAPLDTSTIPVRLPDVDVVATTTTATTASGTALTSADLTPQPIVPGVKAATSVGGVRVDAAKSRNFPLDVIGLDYPTPVNDYAKNRAFTPEQAVPTVIFRDRPFASFNRRTAAGLDEDIKAGPWFNGTLPTYLVPPEQISSSELGKSGVERKNAFFIRPQNLPPEYSAAWMSIQAALWNKSDMLRHGPRKLEFATRYVPPTANYLPEYDFYRQRVRDFHCLNHLFLNGSINLGFGRPDIRIGGKLRVTNATSADQETEDQETYYVEGVQHVWTFQAGVRTTCELSHGWIGTDDELVTALDETVRHYTLANYNDGSDIAPPDYFRSTGGRIGAPLSPPRLSSLVNFTGAEQYPPFSQKAVDLFTQALTQAGLPTTWADPTNPEGRALHTILSNESAGYVGRPNKKYLPRSADVSEWPKIWEEIRNGIHPVSSSATGLGQLLMANVDSFYPGGRQGIGVALPEAVGMIRYIAESPRKNVTIAGVDYQGRPYGAPSVALQNYGKWGEGY